MKERITKNSFTPFQIKDVFEVGEECIIHGERMYIPLILKDYMSYMHFHVANKW